jgi:hypothetical protein
MGKRARAAKRARKVAAAGEPSRVSTGAPRRTGGPPAGPPGPEVGSSSVEPVGALEALRRAAASRDRAQRRLDDCVADARGDGVSWVAVGGLVGMTGEGARKRYGGRAGPPPAAR